ncbi:MAG: hypothetical protein OEY01_03330 [Desulfobulbaceae bacterium]|nr:hypothetical protein [Desulfobulbaceae bacterium]HIJ78324.1 hypothetical protein [Deltaproteobacteria bacterium]
MQISAHSQTAGINPAFWRNKSSGDAYQKANVAGGGQYLKSDKASISSEGSVMAELQKAKTSGEVVMFEDLLTDTEKLKFEQMSKHYGGMKDTELGDIAMTLALDKVMKFGSTPDKLPTIDKDYVLGVMAKMGKDHEGTTAYSRLDYSLLSDLLDNSYLLA